MPILPVQLLTPARAAIRQQKQRVLINKKTVSPLARLVNAFAYRWEPIVPWQPAEAEFLRQVFHALV